MDKPDIRPSLEPALHLPHKDSGIPARSALTTERVKSRSLSPVLKRLRQLHEKKAVDLNSPTSSSKAPSFRSRSLSPTFLSPHTNETKNSSWFLSPSSQIGSLCSSQNVLSFLPEFLSPEKLHQKDNLITERKECLQKAFTADLSSSAVKNVPSKVSTSGQLPFSEKAQPPKILTPLSQGEKKLLQVKPPPSLKMLGGSLAAGVKSSLQATCSQSVSLSRSVGCSNTGRHSGRTNSNSHTAAKFVAASKTSTKPVRSRKRSPQGLSPLLSSRFPVNAPSFVIPQIPAMPSHDIGTYLPAASGGVCSTSLNGKTGFSRVAYLPDLPLSLSIKSQENPAAIRGTSQPKSVIGHAPQLSSVISHTPYSISVMGHSSPSSAIDRTPQSSSTIGHALSAKSSIQKRYQNSTVSKGTSGADVKTRGISLASPPLTTGINMRRTRSSSTSSSALSSPSPPPSETCIAGEPRVGSMSSIFKRYKSTIHHTGCSDSGEYTSKKHLTIPLFQPKTLLGNNSSSILQPSVSPSIVTVMSSSSKPSHSVMPSCVAGSVLAGADMSQVAETSAGKSAAKGSKQARRTSTSSLKSDTDSFSLPSLHDPPRPMVVSSPKKYLSEATEINLPSPSQYTNQYSPNGAFVTSHSLRISSPMGVQSEVLNTSHGTAMAPPFGFPVAHSSGAASPSPSSVTSSSGIPQSNFGVPAVDLSKMSRWEIEQLYYYNTAILEEQKRLMKLIEKHLLETEQEVNKQTVVHKPSTFEVYNNFLEFLTEPDTVPDASINMYGFSEESEINDLIVGGTPYQPIINSKYDVYRKFLNKT